MTGGGRQFSYVSLRTKRASARETHSRVIYTSMARLPIDQYIKYN
jgi:hypothetical protein